MKNRNKPKTKIGIGGKKKKLTEGIKLIGEKFNAARNLTNKRFSVHIEFNIEYEVFQ